MKAKTTTFKKTLNKEKCITFFIRYGYYIHTEDDKLVILRKPGTEFTSAGEKFPKELSFFFKTDETEIRLKYDTYVLFDTGDLQEELDLISNRITNNIDNLV
ncbi:hypothetical protein H0I23_09145 [Cellulophaga sp. HaHaR_3_176]|uniref:hypothetical protein n=1 Tax=Cellulophaga sp. HaHaR_3_176 TaxID=1942464 RepID=UPI001C1F7DF4|nr:hypothetical protein [Cellulophaga sp. HaHaR_3_176]QWX82633.1 hypothetical protein H0I23_09145 [Cellulophaga sp. HaHaR_3_176]